MRNKEWDECNKLSDFLFKYCFVRRTYLGRHHDLFRIFFKTFHRTLYVVN